MKRIKTPDYEGEDRRQMNGNGWVKWLVGVLFTITFTAITTIGTNLIATDKESRERDTKIVETQTPINQKILIELQKQGTTLEFIKEYIVKEKK